MTTTKRPPKCTLKSLCRSEATVERSYRHPDLGTHTFLLCGPCADYLDVKQAPPPVPPHKPRNQSGSYGWHTVPIGVWCPDLDWYDRYMR